MAERPDSERPDRGREERLGRRALQRQRRRRRQRVVGAALVAVAATIVAVVALAGGGSSQKPSTRAIRIGTVSGHVETKPPGLVRNATPQPGWKPYTGPVPILEYHVLGAAPTDAPYP